MRYYDVFNGDADGICALHQLRLADPLDSTLVTGLKHDIELLSRVDGQRGDVVTVLDISMARNAQALMALLGRGAHVRYFDHHRVGSVIEHPDLEAVIDESGAMCTSALVDRHLAGRFRTWAVVGAFGDNMPEAAHTLAVELALSEEALDRLRELGEAMNYNGYGECVEDVLVQPLELYKVVSHYADPLELWRSEPLVRRLAESRRVDLERALRQGPARVWPGADAYVLPREPWSRRAAGTFANRLARTEPDRAHAVLAPLRAGGYVVSIRTPPDCRPCASEFCCGFPKGGGRRDAGGIERIEEPSLDPFLDAFGATFSAAAR